MDFDVAEENDITVFTYRPIEPDPPYALGHYLANEGFDLREMIVRRNGEEYHLGAYAIGYIQWIHLTRFHFDRRRRITSMPDWPLDQLVDEKIKLFEGNEQGEEYSILKRSLKQIQDGGIFGDLVEFLYLSKRLPEDFECELPYLHEVQG